MRVAIIGGTGFVGSYLVDELCDAGHEVSLLVRAGSETKLHRSDLFRTVAGDVASTSALQAVVADCDTVIYCIGILREAKRKGITFEALQYEGLAATVEAAKNAGVQRLILMSANGVKAGGTPYQDTKYRAEQTALASGIPTTVFRPSVVFGDSRGKMEFATQLLDEMVATPVPAIGFFSGTSPAKGPIVMSPVHVQDVAKAFRLALEDESTVGKTYELGGPEVLSWVQIIQRIAAAVGRKKMIVPMPLGIMKLAAGLLDWIPAFPATKDQLTMLQEGNTADPKILEELIGAPPRVFDGDNLQYLRLLV